MVLFLNFSVGYNMALQTYYQEPFSKNGIMNYKAFLKMQKKSLKRMTSGHKVSMSWRVHYQAVTAKAHHRTRSGT